MSKTKPLFSLKTLLDKKPSIIDLDCGSLTELEIDFLIKQQQCEIENYDKKISKLTNEADVIDYSIAAGCGLLSGILGATVFSTNISFENIHKVGSDKAEKSIINRARKEMLKDPKNYDASVLDGKDGLAHAVKFFEKTKSVGDSVKDEFGGGVHHFYDTTHDNSIWGLFASIKAQFTGKVDGIDTITGLKKTVEIEGFNPDLPASGKILKAIMNWSFHIASDTCGTSSTVSSHLGANSFGTGVPGPILSTLKQIGSCSVFQKDGEKGEFMKGLEELFFDKKFDSRSEMGLADQLGKMSLTIMINHLLVRFYFFARRFGTILVKEKVHTLKDALKAAKRSLPFNNRTIKRLLTVSNGVMLGCNLTSAAIKSGGTWQGFLVKINYLQIGDCVVACAVDGIDGIKLQSAKSKQIKEINGYIKLLGAKTSVLYKDVWVNIDDTEECINELVGYTEWIKEEYSDRYLELKGWTEEIGSQIDELDESTKKKMLEELDKE